MLVATTREPSGDPATLFTGERSPKPYLTAVDVSIPPKRASGTVQWPKRLPPNPATDFAVTSVKEIDTVPQGRAWFRQNIQGGHALVFIHGFNNKYEDSVFRLAQIVHDSDMHATPILFTWPLRAQLTAYEYDKESTNYSRTAVSPWPSETLESVSVCPVRYRWSSLFRRRQRASARSTRPSSPTARNQKPPGITAIVLTKVKA